MPNAVPASAPALPKLAAAIGILCVAFLIIPGPADRDPRCNEGGRRYQAMAEGANCSGSEAWPKISTTPNQHKRRK